MEKLFYHGSVITMEEDGLYAEAVLIKDGKILFAGSLKEAEAKAEAPEKIDLKGHTLLPGFIDAHSHFTGVANGLLQISLEACGNFKEIEKTLKQELEARKPAEGSWILVRGYDHNRLEEKRHPSLELLDRVAPEHPMVVQHQSGHVGIFNTAAMKQLEIGADTVVPEGGVIEKKDGKLTGYMEENAFLEYLKKIPLPSAKELLDAYIRAQEVYASHGITTVQEGMLTEEMLPLYQELLKSGCLKLDLVGYADAGKGEEIARKLAGYLHTYKGHFKLCGYKIFLDGSPQGRTAWLREPYEGEKEYRGYPAVKQTDVEETAGMAEKNHMQLLAHCNGDAACAQYLKAVRAVESRPGEMFSALRPVMIHAQMLARDQMEEVKRLQVIPSFFIAHIYHWGDTHIKNLGSRRAAYISPAGSASRMGIPFTFHQDSPVISPDMMETLWCAVNRRTKDGCVLGKEERLDVLSALKAVTVYGAYQYFEETEKGTLSPGKKADLVILDQDPLKVPLENLKDIKVLETIKEGETIYRLSLM